MLTITQVRVRGLSVADPNSGILVSVATLSIVHLEWFVAACLYRLVTASRLVEPSRVKSVAVTLCQRRI